MPRVALLIVAMGFIGLIGCRRKNEQPQAARRSDAGDQAKSQSAPKTRTPPARKTESRPPKKSKARPPDRKNLADLGYIDFAEEVADEEEGDGVVLLDEKRSYPGYNLYNNIRLSSADLIDAKGHVVKSWSYKPSRRWFRCELLPNGDLLIVGHRMKAKDSKLRRTAARADLMRMSWEGEVIWMKAVKSHHDIEVTPRNQILVLTQKHRRLPAIDPDRDVLDHQLTLLTLDGELLEELSLYDVFSGSPDLFTFQSYPKQGPRHAAVDLIHANSVEWMYQPELEARHPMYASSNIIISCRAQDTIAIINWDEKKLVWAWGQGEVQGQHEAAVLKNGNILLFDNGYLRGWSRVLEMDPLTRKIVWEYKAPNPKDFRSAGRGLSQPLPNGNVLVTNSNSGEAFEVTRDGQIVWRFLNPHMDEERHRAIIRMKRYELSYVDRLLERSSPARTSP